MPDIRPVSRGRNGQFPRIAAAFLEVRKIVSRRFPSLRRTGLFIGCPHAMLKHSHHQKKDTDRSGRMWRAFMHTGHFDKMICVHPHAETELKDDERLGLFSHEFGHQVNDILGIPNTQKNADAVIGKYFGLKIRYRAPGRVQYVETTP